MTTRPVKDQAASIRARLLIHAKKHRDDYNRILTRYAIERLLFRLGKTNAAQSYVLKGAMLFVTWPAHAFRPTGDLDLLGDGNPDPETIAELFTTICQVEVPDDGIHFDPASLKVEPVREEDKYQGAQLSLQAELAGAKIRVLVDIGFGDHVFPPPKQGRFPSILTDLPQATILMYPPETVVAEKFEAMIRFGESNGRIKDFYDIWVVSRTFSLDLSNLVEAVGGTLKRRETAIPTEMPVGLTERFAEIQESRGLWSGFLRRNPPTLEPPAFLELQAELRRFLGPVIASLDAPESVRGQWNHNAAAWQ